MFIYDSFHILCVYVIFFIFFLATTESSSESNYVPGSFSAKGRSKFRSPNNAAAVGPANVDKAINQVCFE